MILLRNLHKVFLSFLLLLGSTYSLSAQCFTVDDDKGCAPLTVTTTKCVPASTPVIYDFGDGSDIQFSDGSHIYTTPGVYTVTQYAGTGLGGFDTLQKIDLIVVYDDPEPQFSLYNCANNTILITIDESIYDNYTIDFGDGTTEVLNGLGSTTKTYPNNNERTVTVTGSYDQALCTNQASKTTFLYATLESPNINSLNIINESLASGEIELDISISPYFEYKIKQKPQGAGSFTTIDTIGPLASISSYTISELNTSSQAYDFQIEAFDRCAALDPGNIVSSIILDTSTSPTAINLSWNTSVGTIDHYEVIKDGNATNNNLNTTFIDNNLICNETYCYQIVAYDSPTHPVTYSSTKCIFSPTDTDPQPIDELNISVNNKTTLTWNPPSNVETYTWTRSVNGSTFTPLNNFPPTGNTVIDNNAITTNENCYRLNYIDECDNTPSTPIEACAILLVSQQVDGNEISLLWNDYTYFSSGLANYTITFFEDGNIISSINNGTNTSYIGLIPEDISSTLSIQVAATSNNGETVYSNSVAVSFFAEIHFPTAFTPNDDGLNDTFEPKGQFIKNYDLYIYTRQGELIFHSDNINLGWDGKLPNNQKASQGVYSYVAEVTGNMGDKFTKKGTFTLLN